MACSLQSNQWNYDIGLKLRHLKQDFIEHDREMMNFFFTIDFNGTIL